MKRVRFRPQAARDLERLPNRNRDQVEEAIERFVQTGSGDIQMLAGEGRALARRHLGAVGSSNLPAPTIRK